MNDLAIRRELSGTVEEILPRVEAALQRAGFGVLTRIDLDQKFREKLGATISRTVILGACNPQLAFEAFQRSTDVTLLIPCNVVLRESGPRYVTLEAVRPSRMLALLPEVPPSHAIADAERRLEAEIAGL